MLSDVIRKLENDQYDIIDSGELFSIQINKADITLEELEEIKDYDIKEFLHAWNSGGDYDALCITIEHEENAYNVIGQYLETYDNGIY
jgi:hypothetical protein